MVVRVPHIGCAIPTVSDLKETSFDRFQPFSFQTFGSK
jgi:hypothetical protein